MALHYSDGSYVGGLPAFLGGLAGVAICLGLHFSLGLNFFLSFVIGVAVPLGIMILSGKDYTSQNYDEDIIGKWRWASDEKKQSEENPIYFWEFRKDGTMIWYESWGSSKILHYNIKGKKIYLEGEKLYKIKILIKDGIKDYMMVYDIKRDVSIEFLS